MLAGKDNRAIAGLSMGGGHTLAARKEGRFQHDLSRDSRPSFLVSVAYSRTRAGGCATSAIVMILNRGIFEAVAVAAAYLLPGVGAMGLACLIFIFIFVRNWQATSRTRTAPASRKPICSHGAVYSTR